MNTSRNNLSPCYLASLLADRRGGEYEEQEEQKNGMGAVACHALILPRPTQARNSGRAEQGIARCGWVPRRGVWGLVAAGGMRL